MKGHLISGVLCLLVLSDTSALHAQDELQVVALFGDLDHGVVLQLDGELRALGYRVILMPQDRALSAESLKRTSTRQAFDAAIEVHGAKKSASVWIVADSKVLPPEVSSFQGQEDRVAALRLIEVLRVGWRQRDKPQPKKPLSVNRPAPATPTQTDTAPSAPLSSEQAREAAPLDVRAKQTVSAASKDSVVPSAPSFHLWLSPSSLYSPGGAGPQFGLSLGGGLLLNRDWGVNVWGVVPLGTTLEQGVEQRVSLWSSLMVGEVERFFRLGLANSPWVISAAVGAGVGLTWIRGEAEAPFEGRSDLIATPLARAQAGAGYRVMEGLHLRAHFGAGLMWPEHRIFVLGDLLARRGMLSLDGGLGVRLLF